MEQVDLSKFKDDGSIYSYVYKKEIGIVEGDYSNIKVTTIDDLNKILEDK
jgi:2-C-methyl-D-erythritol 4-phosphate cytidylyltransferase